MNTKEIIEYLAFVWKSRYYDCPLFESPEQERNRAIVGAGFALAIKEMIEKSGVSDAKIPMELTVFFVKNG